MVGRQNIWERLGLVTNETNSTRYLQKTRLKHEAGVVSSPAPVRYQRNAAATPVYAAEKAFRLLYDTDERRDLRFDTIAQAQEYVDQVVSWPWPKWQPPRAQVSPTTGPSPLYRSAIYLPPDKRAMRELVVLHELAHMFSRQYGEAHGLLFVQAFDDLVGNAMGLDARELLRVELRRQEVRYE